MIIADPKFRRKIYEENKSRAQSFFRKGYSKDGELKHVMRIPKIYLSTDPDLLLMQKAEIEGDFKRRDKYCKAFLDRHPECDLERMAK
ncbi:MAG: hypothetical protein WC114_12710 [Smithellaceae bacterium]